MLVLRTVHWKVLWRTQNDSSVALPENPLGTFFVLNWEKIKYWNQPHPPKLENRVYMSLFEPLLGLRCFQLWETPSSEFISEAVWELDAGVVFQNPVWSSTCSASATVWIINEAAVRPRARENKPWPLKMTRTRGLLLPLSILQQIQHVHLKTR